MSESERRENAPIRFKVSPSVSLWTCACVKSIEHKENSTFVFLGTRSYDNWISSYVCFVFCTKDLVLHDGSDLNCFIPYIQTANGNVEAKVVCLFRRRDISGNLNTLADSNASEYRWFQQNKLHACFRFKTVLVKVALISDTTLHVFLKPMWIVAVWYFSILIATLGL